MAPEMTGAEFRRMRESLGFTQEKLGQALGRTSSAVYKWESGRSPVDPLAVRAMLQLQAEQEALKSAEKSNGSTPQKSNSRKRKG